jgi:hypothetical protein
MSSVIKTIPADHSHLMRYASTLYYQIPSILSENNIIFSCYGHRSQMIVVYCVK